MLGGWFLVEAVVLSVSTGIVHPYYVSALGAGHRGDGGRRRGGVRRALTAPRRAYLTLPVGALIATVVMTLVLLHREYDYLALVLAAC